HANDLVIESEFGVIHATISAFVETTTRIIRSQLEEGFANLDASEAALSPLDHVTANRSHNSEQKMPNLGAPVDVNMFARLDSINHD
ncbi:MAG: hypothetical protein ACRCWJ_03015, partial [Casimicrobium sp.]